MNKNLRWKVIVIVVTMVVFLFGIFGIPKSWSGRGLLAAMTDRIHLGLDLKGGTHLILQVQVNDAVKADADRADGAAEGRDAHATRSTTPRSASRIPSIIPTKSCIKGVPPEATTDLRTSVSDRLPEYDCDSGPENSWTFCDEAAGVTDLKNRA